MKLEDVRVGMILRDAVEDDWTVVGIDGGTLRVVSVLQPNRIIHGVKPDRTWPTAVGPAPASAPPVEEPEPEAEADPEVTDEAWLRVTVAARTIDAVKVGFNELPDYGSGWVSYGDVISPPPSDFITTMATMERERNSALKERDELKAKLNEAYEDISMCRGETWYETPPRPFAGSGAPGAIEAIRELRNDRNELLAKVDDLKGKLSRAEKQAEQARKLWASWRDQKEALAALDAEFGEKS